MNLTELKYDHLIIHTSCLGVFNRCFTIRDHPQKMSPQILDFWGTHPQLVSSNLLVNVSFLGIFCTPVPPPLGRRLLWMFP